MEAIKKQAPYIGNGPSETPAEPGSGPTEASSIVSPPNTDSGYGNTTNGEKPEESPISSDSLSSLNESPNTIEEALALLQTRLFDLRSLGLKLALQGNNGKLYIVIAREGHALSFEDGHIRNNGTPVVDL